MSSEERVRHIELTWRCSTCGHQNLGRHKQCVACGHEKDASEAYEMPADPRTAVNVTDDPLLRMAKAGPDWRCAYCGADQRRSQGSCANCGAPAVEGSEVPDDAPPPPAAAAPPRPRRRLRWVALLALPVIAVAGIAWNASRPRDWDATVQAVSWEHVIDVERYAARAGEGFKENIPADAFDVRGAGERVHHQERVLDHYETERYAVEVPDGTRSETYTARVACGEDCSETPRSCRESCKNDKNGFATCREVCTGGGRRCSTRYCSETRTRQVPKTRTEWRSRQVPRYRQEPRYAEAFRWRVWTWAPARSIRAAGTETTGLRWPNDETRVGAGLASGEKERATRKSRYLVTLRYDEDKDLRFEPPSAEAFASFTPGSRHAVRREHGKMFVNGAAIAPLEERP
jgi:hypothetical protein